jgi:group I intron endonuclease
MYSIYKVISPSGKLYFGLTNNFSKRKSRHYTKAKNGLNTPFAKALRKYNKDMQWSIVDTVHTLEEAAIIEKNLIKEFSTTNREFGYNITLGGEGSLGRPGWSKGKKLSLETRKKMSESKKGIVSKPTGWKHTEEAKEKMKRNYKPHIAHNSKHTEESKIKMSISHKKRHEENKNVSS